MKFLVSVILVLVQSIHCSEYDYERLGPDAWFLEFPACGGSAQSPINIITKDVIHDDKLAPFKFINYQKLPFQMKITEHSVEFTQDPYAPVMSVGGSNFDYHTFEFVNGHFHWGFNDFQGSEHTVNDKKFPLEMHLVHRLKEEEDPENLKLVVLGVFFTLAEYDNPHLDEIIYKINQLNQNYLEEIDLNIDLLDLLPKELHYYRYDGSLTTPPCVEVVTWSVLRESVPISAYQLNVFRTLELKKNFRDPQPLNCRSVYASFKPYAQDNCPYTSSYHHVFGIEGYSNYEYSPSYGKY